VKRTLNKITRAGGKEAKESRSQRESGDEEQLRVRMYRVGFGDFFLLTVPSKKLGPQHVLIDCGVTTGRTGKGDIGVIKDAVAHMAKETGEKLALIIATHRHKDHIIGFSRCPEFQRFKGKVGAIWMPIWETEYDQNIRKIQNGMSALALDAQAYVAAAGDRLPHGEDILAMLDNALGMEQFGVTGSGGGSNAASLAILKNGFGVKPKYYQKGHNPELPPELVEAGLSAEILGPPPVDAMEFMKLTDLRKGVGQYLGASGNENEGEKKRFRPFRPEFDGKPEDYPAAAFLEWESRSEEEIKDPWQQLKNAIDSAQPDVLLAAVKRLDDFLNNQSLVVLFTFRDKKLLFAGDAQAGNWEYWLYGPNQAPTTTPSSSLADEGRKILGRLDFYKVGHHGSTNATPIVAVDAMNEGFVSMCSTQADSFGSEKNNSEVPRIPLLEALAKKSAVARSDQLAVKIQGKLVDPAKNAPQELPRPKAGRFDIGPCYVDYLL